MDVVYSLGLRRDKWNDPFLQKLPKLQAWIKRRGLTAINFKKYVKREKDEHGYSNDVARARLDDDGKIVWDKPLERERKPTKEEEEREQKEIEEIEAEIAAAAAEDKLPKSIPALVANAKEHVRSLAGDCSMCLDPSSGEVLFIEERRENDGDKSFCPWTWWSDGIWRAMEPEDGVPPWGLERAKDHHKIMMHEGIKAAKAVSGMTKAELDAHPLGETLRECCHVGVPCGTNRVRAVNWFLIKEQKNKRLIYVCDNDQGGVAAATEISEMLKMPLEVILFDSRFPVGFDLADPWPKHEKWWKKGRYVGPSFEDCLFPATWATWVGKPAGKGRPPVFMRKEFAKEWFWVVDPPVFAHENHPDRLLSETGINRDVRPFSNTANTAALLIEHLPSKCDTVTYDPSQKPGLINIGRQRVLNTFRPSSIKAARGDAKPFLEFMERLIPDEHDRTEVLRWSATLVVRPDVKMSYGVLLVSETQGVGKGTLGENILAALVGESNASVPDEQEITEGNFNSWIPHKRLAIVHEIYSGHSLKAYNKLKSVITDKRVRAKIKFVKEYEIDVWVHIFACSNSMRALRLEDTDRRWLVPRVTEMTQLDSYWQDFNRWLRDDDGLGIIRRFFEEWLKTHEPVLKGQHAPMTTRKKELIEEGRSDIHKLALNLARSICEEVETALKEKKDRPKIIVAVEEVRRWAADELKIGKNEWKMEKPKAILEALKEGGLVAATEADGSLRRFSITPTIGNKMSSSVVATFDIAPDKEWKEIGSFYRERDEFETF